MASLGHIAVAIAAAHAARAEAGPPRRSLGAIAFWSALSFLPAAGHSHWSGGDRRACQPCTARHADRRRPGLRAALAVRSHALFWRPIPVAPIGLAYFSPYGLYVAATELLLFAPLLWIMRRRVSIPMLGIWAAALWLLLSGDPTRERIVRAVLQDTTEYAPRFAESALDAVEEGDTKQQVRDRLGAPFREIAVGAESVCWVYSRSPDGRYFRARGVCFTGGGVAAVVRRWMRE